MQRSITYWKAVPLLIVGALIGLIILISLRIEYYHMMDYKPNMAPQIAFFFSPLLLLEIMIVALPLEFICRRYWYVPASSMQTVLIGLGYSTLLTWWAFPDHWQIILILNPLTMRWLIILCYSNREMKNKRPYEDKTNGS